FPAGCQDAGKPVKFPQSGTFRTKQGPVAAATRFPQTRTVPPAKAVKPETQSRVYIGVGTITIVDSRYALGSTRAVSDEPRRFGRALD
ncbi:MAG: hypothetical protein ACRED2_06285, partial [Methylocella sp.]